MTACCCESLQDALQCNSMRRMVLAGKRSKGWPDDNKGMSALHPRCLSPSGTCLCSHGAAPGGRRCHLIRRQVKQTGQACCAQRFTTLEFTVHCFDLRHVGAARSSSNLRSAPCCLSFDGSRIDPRGSRVVTSGCFSWILAQAFIEDDCTKSMTEALYLGR